MSVRGLAVLVACVLLQGEHVIVRGAAIIEDHTTSWGVAGLSDSLAEAFDVALPDDLFDKVLEEALVFEKHERDERSRAAAAGGAYVHGKGGTYWRPLYNAQGEFLRPRFYIEAAIQMLYEMDMGQKTPHARVTGGEWWIQKRDLKEDIGFHHDKDEAMASLKSTMKFPEVSTVTYLTGQGAPTVVFNQTTPDGNGAMPITPRHGVLSYPLKNRHLRFQGNLQHGVPAFLAPELQDGTIIQLRGSGRERITFLVNWWKDKPLGPNCNKVTTKLVKHLGVYDLEGVARLMATPQVRNHVPQPTIKRDMIVPPTREERTRHDITIPGEEIIWFDLPKQREKGIVYNIRWPTDGIFANLCKLDLRTDVVRSLFHEDRSKVMVFAANEEATLEWLRPLASEMEDELRFVIANPTRTIDALKTFGLEVKDCPAAVIHTTRPHDVKYLMPKKKNKEDGSVKRRVLNAKNLRKMINKFRAGKLPPIGGNDADDDDE